MDNNIQGFLQIEKELIEKYSIEKTAIENIIIESITEVYGSQYPILLEDDGVFAVFDDKKDKTKLKFFKITYSKKKIQLIQNKILEKAIKKSLVMEKEKIKNFIENKKSYLHAVFSHTYNNKDYYNLFFDRKHNHKINNVYGIAKHNGDKKKERIYPAIKTHYIENNYLLIPEYKNIITIKTIKEMTKDISNEIYEKIEKRVWIEICGINKAKKEVYIHLPYRTKSFIIDYIKKRYYDVFELKAVTNYYKR